MKSNLIGIALIVLLTSMLANAQNDTPMEVMINIANANERFIKADIFTEDDRSSTHLDDYLDHYSTFKLDKDKLRQLVASKYEYLTLDIPNPNGGDFELKVVSYDIRSENFKVYEKSNGVKTEIEVPDASYYRGVMTRGFDTQAGISLFENEIYGLFSSLDGGNVVVSKDPIQPGKNDENYIVYYEKDLKFERELNCVSDKLEAFDNISLDDIGRSNVYDTCEDIEVEIEATHKLFMQKGSNSTALSNYITAFFNNVSVIYRNENIYTSIGTLIINTSTDGYASLTTAQSKLFAYGGNTQNTYQNSKSELAHLLDYNDPGLGGIAWINVLCRNYLYNSGQHYGAYAYSSIEDTHQEFPDYSLTVFMFSHEMGHNLGSRHTQSCSWVGGPIDNCAPVENGSCDPGPTPTNGGTIMSYCHTKPGIGINYSNGFGDQPGDRIRSLTQSKTCTEKYTPTGIQACVASTTITANRECTDANGWTYYYSDSNTSNESDDKWLLAVNKNGEDIGNLNDGSLVVQVKTSSKAGSGSTHISNPGYSVNEDWHVMNRWFELIPTNEPNNPVTVRFPYTSDDFGDVMANQPNVTAHTDLTFYKISLPGDPNPDMGHSNVDNEDIVFYENGQSASLTEWKYINSGSNRHIAEFKVSSFSGGGGGFTETAAVVVPVELLSFDAKKENQVAVLEWSTAMESDSDFFTIERSEDGIQFVEIGKVKSTGNSSTKMEYEFVDRAPTAGINYYRLKQNDFNGNSEYLGVRSLNFRSTTQIDVYPNPFSGNDVTLSYQSAKRGELDIMIRNIEGKLIAQLSEAIEIGANNLSLDFRDLASGIYFVQTINDGNVKSFKLIKK